MAHFAQIENNIVTQVIVINNDVITVNGIESEQAGIDFCKSLYGADTEWVQSSYNGNFRKNPAGVGSTYSKEHDAFITVQPYPSWSLDETFNWAPPEPYPNIPFTQFSWNESKLMWEERQ